MFLSLWKTDKLSFSDSNYEPILFPFFSCLPGSSEMNLMFEHRNYLASDNWSKDVFFPLPHPAHYFSSGLCLFADFVFNGLSFLY